MIEVLPDMPEGVTGIRVSGRLSGDDRRTFNHSAFKRIAVVTDKEWVVHTLHALAWLVPGEIALFGLDDLEQAKAWAAG